MSVEECDTAYLMQSNPGGPDYTHGCDRLCQRSTEQTTNSVGATIDAWVCTHYYLDVMILEHP